jgi:uncharacterized iron-regulated membrane protein
MRPLGWLVLLVIVTGLVWAVVWGPLKEVPSLLSQPEKATQPAPVPAPAVQEPEKKPAAKPTRMRSSAGVGAAPAEAETVSTPAPQPPVPAAAPSPPRKFPTAAELPVGMRGSNIEAAFGPPVAKTISVDQRGQIEIYIYRRGDPNTATFIHLRDGKVISASTTLY